MPHGDHDHSGHSHAPAEGHDRAFAIGVGLNTLLVAAQVVAGLFAGSLALLADAGHNLGDVLGLLMAWGGAVMARRPPTARRTYGYGRGTILSSLANAVVLLVGVGAIALEAIQRLFHPAPVAGQIVMWVALAGILINGFTAWLFMAGRKDDLNIRGAFLHMASDAGVSAGVVIAAIVIQFTGWWWLDSLTGLAISAVILISTWGLLRESVDLAMDVVPPRIDRADVETYLATLPGVCEVHDLHIWGLSTTDTALTVHLVRTEDTGDDALLTQASHDLRHRFGIGHATFQLERGTMDCALAPAHIV